MCVKFTNNNSWITQLLKSQMANFPKTLHILGLQSISRDAANNVSHPRRLDPKMEFMTYSFVLYLQHGRHDVKCKPSIVVEQEYNKHVTVKVLISA